MAAAQDRAQAAEPAQAAERLRDCEAVIRSLTEELAVARTEAELLRQQWLGSRLQPPQGDAPATAAAEQRRLAECLQSLQQVQAERQYCRQLLQRLVQAAGGDEPSWQMELARAREWLAAETVAGLQWPAPQALAAVRVLEVESRLRLVVLAAGARQGVRVGMPFLIRRGEQVLGRVRVVEVRAEVSGAVLEDWGNKPLPLAGDVAQATKG